MTGSAEEISPIPPVLSANTAPPTAPVSSTAADANADSTAAGTTPTEKEENTKVLTTAEVGKSNVAAIRINSDTDSTVTKAGEESTATIIVTGDIPTSENSANVVDKSKAMELETSSPEAALSSVPLGPIIEEVYVEVKPDDQKIAEPRGKKDGGDQDVDEGTPTLVHRPSDIPPADSSTLAPSDSNLKPETGHQVNVQPVVKLKIEVIDKTRESYSLGMHYRDFGSILVSGFPEEHAKKIFFSVVKKGKIDHIVIELEVFAEVGAKPEAQVDAF